MLNNFILIGGTGVGKSTLFAALLNQEEEVRKTQALVFHDECTIDTPGEYFDNPRLYTALISTMTDIKTIVYVHQANSLERKLPFGLFSIYDTKKIIGVISKIDLADAEIAQVEEIIRDAGIHGPIFPVSIYQPESIDTLRLFLSKETHAASQQGA
ncbi:MAG TPA: EutP/PduV family microcompartment system protein [bacterium]|nr:EutP/PduV family microcompartment system protein [bacterium]HNT65257.1 EutP/PduV family microcompartment system protein [bacterium]HOX86940.1 EutP/PduV family microcompartment system protein [bacterium]HPG46271.1 EutP/PduV family microcompartment system protein [bacterium]HPM98535.1 EutP/PduV family microcompartment system protein [bacterium]